MSTYDDNSLSGQTDKLIVITDFDGNPVKVDTNPAHFDGLVQEIADFALRTGHFLPYLENGIALRGSKTITDSAASVPFLQGMVTNAKTYSVRDPCPPTSTRVADHNAAMAASGSPTITPLARVPATASDIVVNQYIVNKEGLSLGNSIAACFEDAKYIHRIREGGAMNGRDLIIKLLALGNSAEPAEKTLVISRFTNFVEKPVLVALDEKSFDEWYSEATKLHRRMPRAAHKTDADWCEYLNTLFYSQPSWRDNFELKMARLCRRRDVPKGRRLHKFVWVYKIKRSGEVKVRLCVQGCTLEAGVDFDQTFSSTLRHCSARSLFAHAARCGCNVRSIDFVSAYLQGSFLDGEVIYCHMPDGYEVKDEDGVPMVCVIEKPIYGIPQAGRRLQRAVFDWMLEDGSQLRQLDDSDNTIFVYENENSSEVFACGVYVDNLQIVHSVDIDENGDAVDPNSFLASFLKRLRDRWDVVDEGPMVDLLGMECEYLPNGQIKLHQDKYVQKCLDKYLPDGPPPSISPSCLPYTANISASVEEALLLKETDGVCYPELVTPFQQKCGSYMYLNTSTRPDIAYPVSQLCRAMSCPTPALMTELDQMAYYLHFNSSIGLTYNATPCPLEARADASWLTRFSVSGWHVDWQGCAISWGSRKQDCVALSSCEAEIVALSECAKDVVYLRKKLKGLDPAYVSDATSTATDSKGAHDLSYNPEFHARSKHIKRRHFFVRDMVEEGELVVPLVRTHENSADFLTKAMPPDKFFEFRDYIMNVSAN